MYRGRSRSPVAAKRARESGSAMPRIDKSTRPRLDGGKTPGVPPESMKIRTPFVAISYDNGSPHTQSAALTGGAFPVRGLLNGTPMNNRRSCDACRTLILHGPIWITRPGVTASHLL